MLAIWICQKEAKSISSSRDIIWKTYWSSALSASGRCIVHHYHYQENVCFIIIVIKRSENPYHHHHHHQKKWLSSSSLSKKSKDHHHLSSSGWLQESSRVFLTSLRDNPSHLQINCHHISVNSFNNQLWSYPCTF